MTVYRIVTRLIHAALYPVGKLRAGRGDRKWRDRLGLEHDLAPADLWLHASSVGEVKVLAHLLDYLKRKRPEVTVHVTVMTDAGYTTAQKVCGDRADLCYLPVDVTGVVRRVLDSVRPRCLAIAETEIWPNLVTEAHRREIPIVLVNGRMSEKSFAQYRLIGFFMRTMLRRYDRFFFKSVADAERYRYFGVDDSRSQVTGDMKFDAPLYPRSLGRREEMRYRCGATDNDFVLVAGSTRPGEEALLLDALTPLNRTAPDCKLVIAPRHVERADEIRRLLDQRGIKHAEYDAPDPAATVVLIDRMGILMDLYLAADLAFVGGTLADIGGHNILEPVWAGTPVVYGPSLQNVIDAAEYIESNNFGDRINDITELVATVEQMRSGDRTFATKTENDLDRSATAVAGDYILKKLDHAGA